jgi:hypothetical protein
MRQFGGLNGSSVKAILLQALEMPDYDEVAQLL